MRRAIPNNALLSRWSETLSRRSRDAAIFGADGGVVKTFAQVNADAVSWSERLSGLRGGAVVGIQVGNSPHWPAILLACFRRGLVPLPIGNLDGEALESALTSCHAEALLRSARDEPKLELRALNCGLRITDCGFLKLTSGPTAVPRAIRFTAEQLVADCDNICETMGITEDDLNFGVIPFAHSYGFGSLVAPLICRGVPLVATEQLFPRAILNGLAATGATVFPSMPVFFQTLAELPDLPALPRLRLCVSASAPLMRRVGAAFRERFGLRVHNFYGASECGGIAYDASDEADVGEGQLGSPLRGVRIEPLPGDRIAITGDAVGAGYLPEDDPTTLADGRFIPPDLVRPSGSGFQLIGRVSDVINVAGRKLSPAAVEAQLLRCPGVREAVVFAIPSVLRNEEPVACVAGADRAAVLRHVREHLTEWQRPRDIWLVDAIPGGGKMSRRELAIRYLERAAN